MESINHKKQSHSRRSALPSEQSWAWLYGSHDGCCSCNWLKLTLLSLLRLQGQQCRCRVLYDAQRLRARYCNRNARLQQRPPRGGARLRFTRPQRSGLLVLDEAGGGELALRGAGKVVRERTRWAASNFSTHHQPTSCRARAHD
eukprot:761995-Pleurochrysis_carterae.AAC.1